MQKEAINLLSSHHSFFNPWSKSPLELVYEG